LKGDGGNFAKAPSCAELGENCHHLSVLAATFECDVEKSELCPSAFDLLRRGELSWCAGDPHFAFQNASISIGIMSPVRHPVGW
jgi:hypothetical protein